MGRPFLMTADRWARVEDLFDRAADLPRADRAAFLDAACRDADGTPDRALREEVDRMLALDTGADGFFHDLTGGGLGVPDDPMAGVPERVGPWRLVREVGKGGMGTVYLAERDDGTFAQRAAVKLVRPGLADDLVARFRAERHLLARLEHPGIARQRDRRPRVVPTAHARRPREGMHQARGRTLRCPVRAVRHEHVNIARVQAARQGFGKD